jgi:hypothetical protein
MPSLTEIRLGIELGQLALRIFGPIVQAGIDAAVSAFAAKNPGLKDTDLAKGYERFRALTMQTALEIEQLDMDGAFGALMSKVEKNTAKKNAAMNILLGDPNVEGALGRIAAEGFGADPQAVASALEDTVTIINYGPGGKKLPAPAED